MSNGHLGRNIQHWNTENLGNLKTKPAITRNTHPQVTKAEEERKTPRISSPATVLWEHTLPRNFSDHARIVNHITVRPQELVTTPNLFVSCMDNLNTSLRITYHLVGMSEKLKITSAGVFTRSSHYFDTTDSKQNAFLQSLIQCILQGNTVSWHRYQHAFKRQTIFLRKNKTIYFLDTGYLYGLPVAQPLCRNAPEIL